MVVCPGSIPDRLRAGAGSDTHSISLWYLSPMNCKLPIYETHKYTNFLYSSLWCPTNCWLMDRTMFKLLPISPISYSVSIDWKLNKTYNWSMSDLFLYHSNHSVQETLIDWSEFTLTIHCLEKFTKWKKNLRKRGIPFFQAS